MPIKFIPFNKWEITVPKVEANGQQVENDPQLQWITYYGKRVHVSRVIKMFGPVVPAPLRARLQGWGSSVMEACMRELNLYLEHGNAIFDLLKQSKTDVLKIENLKATLATGKGVQGLMTRLHSMEQVKGINGAMILDNGSAGVGGDDFAQKTYNFAGIMDVFNTAMTALSAACKIPENKLFGKSASGLNATDEAAQENYNSLVETEIRGPSIRDIHKILDIRMMQLFGFMPEDYAIEFPPLRELDAIEEEAVKTSKQSRLMALNSCGFMNGEELGQALLKWNLIDEPTLVSEGKAEQADQMPQGQLDGETGKKAGLGKPPKSKGQKAKAQSRHGKEKRQYDK
jgi:hypothetical protein